MALSIVCGKGLSAECNYRTDCDTTTLQKFGQSPAHIKSSSQGSSAPTGSVSYSTGRTGLGRSGFFAAKDTASDKHIMTPLQLSQDSTACRLQRFCTQQSTTIQYLWQPWRRPNRLYKVEIDHCTVAATTHESMNMPVLQYRKMLFAVLELFARFSAAPLFRLGVQNGMLILISNSSTDHN